MARDRRLAGSRSDDVTRANRSPRSGDLVRAITNDRDAKTVEGVLDLRYVPSLDYVQVMVEGEHVRPVRPDSIEVLQEAAVPPEALEANDPLTSDPRHRRIVDLQQAADEGLLDPPRQFPGGSWDDMFATLARLEAPLVEAGWRVTETVHEHDGWEHGDLVLHILVRAEAEIEVEYNEHDEIIAFDGSDEIPEGEEQHEPRFSLLKPTVTSARRQFAKQGWLP